MTENRSVADLAWAAGIIDAKASFFVTQDTQMVVRFATWNHALALRMQRILGGVINGPYKGTNVPQYYWRIQRVDDVEDMYMSLRNYLLPQTVQKILDTMREAESNLQFGRRK
jgi:hypothetical protein